MRQGSGRARKVTSVIRFRPMTEDDLPAIAAWLALPHVARWWTADTTAEAELAEYRQRITDGADPATIMLMVLLDGVPVGWCQWYRWADYPAEAAEMGARDGEAGIDYAIGDPECIGRGVGTYLIAALVAEVRGQHPGAGILADPDAANVGVPAGAGEERLRARRGAAGGDGARRHADGDLPAAGSRARDAHRAAGPASRRSGRPDRGSPRAAWRLRAPGWHSLDLGGAMADSQRRSLALLRPRRVTPRAWRPKRARKSLLDIMCIIGTCRAGVSAGCRAGCQAGLSAPVSLLAVCFLLAGCFQGF